MERNGQGEEGKRPDASETHRTGKTFLEGEGTKVQHLEEGLKCEAPRSFSPAPSPSPVPSGTVSTDNVLPVLSCERCKDDASRFCDTPTIAEQKRDKAEKGRTTTQAVRKRKADGHSHPTSRELVKAFLCGHHQEDNISPEYLHEHVDIPHFVQVNQHKLHFPEKVRSRIHVHTYRGERERQRERDRNESKAFWYGGRFDPQKHHHNVSGFRTSRLVGRDWACLY